MAGITSDCGWLGPDGSWHPCGEKEHKDTARAILAAAGERVEGPDRSIFGDPEKTLEERGWAKLIPDQGWTRGFVSYGLDTRLTRAQKRRLIDWCTGDGRHKTMLPAELEPDPLPEDLP